MVKKKKKNAGLSRLEWASGGKTKLLELLKPKGKKFTQEKFIAS